MNSLLSLIVLFFPAPRVESKFEQIAPEPPLGKLIGRTPGRLHAVVLIHGLHPHPFSSQNVTRPLLRDWQSAETKLVQELVKRADVYAFAYAQDVAVEDVASGSELRENLATLRKLGYRDIALVGHSAGGLVARQFVEDHPDRGVTRVIQVCTPNVGSNWARVPATVRRSQTPFLKSLTREHRRKWLAARSDLRIPGKVSFACLMGTGLRDGDGIVARDSQWSEDLQKQGIPVYALDITHITAMRNTKTIETLATVLAEDLPRWPRVKVAEARRSLLQD